jgi:hypothetical protein
MDIEETLLHNKNKGDVVMHDCLPILLPECFCDVMLLSCTIRTTDDDDDRDDTPKIRQSDNEEETSNSSNNTKTADTTETNDETLEEEKLNEKLKENLEKQPWFVSTDNSHNSHNNSIGDSSASSDDTSPLQKTIDLWKSVIDKFYSMKFNERMYNRDQLAEIYRKLNHGGTAEASYGDILKNTFYSSGSTNDKTISEFHTRPKIIGAEREFKNENENEITDPHKIITMDDETRTIAFPSGRCFPITKDDSVDANETIDAVDRSKRVYYLFANPSTRSFYHLNKQLLKTNVIYNEDYNDMFDTKNIEEAVWHRIERHLVKGEEGIVCCFARPNDNTGTCKLWRVAPFCNISILA